jgi:hypothetical protein
MSIDGPLGPTDAVQPQSTQSTQGNPVGFRDLRTAARAKRRTPPFRGFPQILNSFLSLRALRFNCIVRPDCQIA